MIRVTRQCAALALNTIREALSNRLLYAVALFAAVALSATGVFGALSLHQEERLFRDLVYFSSTVFLFGLATYQGVNSVTQEIQKKSVTTVLSKPVSRVTFVVGKYLGSVTVVVLGLFIIVGSKIAAALVLDFDVTRQFASAYYGLFLQLLIVSAIAILFSTLSSPLLAALITIGLTIAGSLTPQLREAAAHFAEKDNPVQLVAEAALTILPDLEKLNLSFELTHGVVVPATYLIAASGYAVLYSAIVLSLSAIVFGRQDFS